MVAEVSVCLTVYYWVGLEAHNYLVKNVAADPLQGQRLVLPPLLGGKEMRAKGAFLPS